MYRFISPKCTEDSEKHPAWRAEGRQASVHSSGKNNHSDNIEVSSFIRSVSGKIPTLTLLGLFLEFTVLVSLEKYAFWTFLASSQNYSVSLNISWAFSRVLFVAEAFERLAQNGMCMCYILNLNGNHSTVWWCGHRQISLKELSTILVGRSA